MFVSPSIDSLFQVTPMYYYNDRKPLQGVYEVFIKYLLT